MAVIDSEFLKSLRATFRVEAEEHVGGISAGLVELERATTAGEKKRTIETIFREAHSLKGAARSVNITEIEKICQALESVFAALKREEIDLSAELFDTLHQAVDNLSQFLATLDAERTILEKKRTRDLVRRLQTTIEGQASALTISEEHAATRHPEISDATQAESEDEIKLAMPAPLKSDAARQSGPSPGEKVEREKTVRITTAKLDALLLQAEELLSTKLTARERAAQLRQMCATLANWKKDWSKAHADARSLRLTLEVDDQHNGRRKENGVVKRLVEYLDQHGAFLKALEAQLTALTLEAEQDGRSLGGMVDGLLEGVKKVLMLPATALLEIFPKVVRDLARDQGKEIGLTLRGGEVEIDRRILEEIKDPLIHLVRNSVDHGIEKPAERTSKNKPPRGTLTLAITQKSGSEVEIVVADDGAGVDVRKVKAAALKSGALSENEFERLDEREQRLLILRSGLSTSPLVTDISGHGLGLAIVQERVEKLGGALMLESRAGVGTTFRITLPLTLATFRGILIRAGSQHFIVPTASVKRVLRAAPEEVGALENRETIKFDGQLIPFVRLAKVLGLASNETTVEPTERALVVVLGAGERRIGFVVEEILDEQEVLVKSFGRQLARVRNIAGATVLGAGRLVPILDVADLMKSAEMSSIAPTKSLAAAGKGEAKRVSILIAEDSITARTLLKNILESAGYNVAATVDGAAALTELKTGDYDLLVSDVEMPRMNGFELTAKIREDERLGDLPIVLVTSLDSSEDRERGVDAGANAYIVKSSFDQSNLLETIRRMI